MQQPYRGVLRRSDGAFIAAIMVHGEVVGCSSFAFETPEAAAHHYDALALARYGPGLAITNYDEWGRRVYTPPTSDAELELRAWRQSRGNLPTITFLRASDVGARAPAVVAANMHREMRERQQQRQQRRKRRASTSSEEDSDSDSDSDSAYEPEKGEGESESESSEEEEEEPKPKPAPKRGKKAIPKAPAKPKAKRTKKVPFVGVTQITSGRFQARIRVDKDSTNSLQLGSFEKAEDAARLYDEMARKYRGPGALLNFPTEEDLEKGYRKFEL